MYAEGNTLCLADNGQNKAGTAHIKVDQLWANTIGVSATDTVLDLTELAKGEWVQVGNNYKYWAVKI